MTGTLDDHRFDDRPWGTLDDHRLMTDNFHELHAVVCSNASADNSMRDGEELHFWLVLMG